MIGKLLSFWGRPILRCYLSFREGICLAYSCCHCLVHMLAKCKNVDPFHARIWFSPGSTGGGCHSWTHQVTFPVIKWIGTVTYRSHGIVTAINGGYNCHLRLSQPQWFRVESPQYGPSCSAWQMTIDWLASAGRSWRWGRITASTLRRWRR